MTHADRTRLECDLADAKAAAIVARATAAGYERGALFHEHDDAVGRHGLYARAWDRQQWWELRAEDEEETAEEIRALLTEDEAHADQRAFYADCGGAR